MDHKSRIKKLLTVCIQSLSCVQKESQVVENAHAPKLRPDVKPRTMRDDVKTEMSENSSEASCSCTRRESREKPRKRKRMDVSPEDPDFHPDERPRKRRRTETDETVKTEMSENISEASCSFTRRESKKKPQKRKRMDVSPEEPDFHPDKRSRKWRRKETDNTVKTEMSENISEAPCSFTRRKSKEKPQKRKRMDVSPEEPDFHPDKRSRKWRRKETDNTVKTEMSENISEAPCSFTRRKSKEKPQKRKRMDVSPEEPDFHPDKRSRKWRRKETDNTVKTEMSENISEAPCSFTRRKSKEKPQKRKRMDVSHEEPDFHPVEKSRKRTRTETDNTMKTEMSKNNSEASCSFTRKEHKKNPLKRKRVDVFYEESELQQEKRPGKRRQIETEEPEPQSEETSERKMTETENDVNRKKSENDTEASCSIPVQKVNSTAISHQEPELQPEETPERTETEDNGTKPVKKDNSFQKANFSEHYTVLELLGKGRYGSVYAGVRNTDGKKVAIKYVDKNVCERLISLPGDTRRLHREVALLELVSKPPHCPYVIEFLEWYETDKSFILVLERPDPCVDLYEYCRGPDGKNMSETLAQNIMKQVVQAAIYCHERGVLHRDIKPGNLLLNLETFNVKLIDFGSGDLLKDIHYTEYAGTEMYLPPEFFLGRKYEAEPTTVWSLGIVLYNLLCGDMPFYNSSDIVWGGIFLPDHLSEASRSLIRWCLERYPQKRPSLKQILEHHWF